MRRDDVDPVGDDQEWFRASPQTNFRLRPPGPGEVDEIGRAMRLDGVPWDGGLPPPLTRSRPWISPAGRAAVLVVAPYIEPAAIEEIACRLAGTPPAAMLREAQRLLCELADHGVERWIGFAAIELALDRLHGGSQPAGHC